MPQELSVVSDVPELSAEDWLRNGESAGMDDLEKFHAMLGCTAWRICRFPSLAEVEGDEPIDPGQEHIGRWIARYDQVPIRPSRKDFF